MTLTEAIEFLYYKIEILELALLKCLNPLSFCKLEKSKSIQVDITNNDSIYWALDDIRKILCEMRDL